MTPIDRVVGFSQILALVAWEALGVVAFDWDPLAIFGCWFVGLWTFNILTATAVRTYVKLMTPRAVIQNNVTPEVHISPEDIGG